MISTYHPYVRTNPSHFIDLILLYGLRRCLVYIITMAIHQNATVDSTHCRHCTLFTVMMQQEEAQGLVEPHGNK